MQILVLASSLLDLPFVLGGHGYDVGGSSREGPGGDHGDGGFGLPWILAGLALALVTVGVLVSLDPSGARAKLKGIGPKALLVVVLAAPLVAWSAFSKGGASDLVVERATGANGAPELVLWLADPDLNTLATTGGKRAVRVECLGRDDRIVLAARQKWPFPKDPGYDFPHAHQAATSGQLEEVDRCRLRGTRARLEADVRTP